MQISVVLPLFNEERFMHIALDSLNEQTVPFELVIVDNGSTDRTVEIAKLYTPLVFTAPRGKLNAKQLGVYEASGDVVVMVDADMYYPPNFLATLTKHFADPNVVMATGLFHQMDTPRLTQFANVIRVGFLNLFAKYTSSPVTAYRRDSFLKAGGYNLNVNQFDIAKMWFEEECGFNWRIMRFGRIVYEPKAVAYHYPRREACERCPLYSEEHICTYCQEIAERQRF